MRYTIIIITVFIMKTNILEGEHLSSHYNRLSSEMILNDIRIKNPWNSYILSPLEDYNTESTLNLSFRVKLPRSAQVGTILIGALAGVGIELMMNSETREKFVLGWELITSPNHAFPENYGNFHFKSWEVEKRQNTQADKGVHFTTGFYFVKPVSILCQYLVDGFSTILGGKNGDGVISDGAYYLASALVMTGGFFEEYVDGYQKDEGFSIRDFIANISGVTFSFLKRKGKFSDIYFFWSFHNLPKHWKYPWWDYMPGYEFAIWIDLSKIFGRYEYGGFNPTSWWSYYIGYLPSFDFVPSYKVRRYYGGF